MKHYSRETDHLGTLATNLKDLQGFSTLVHELLQNADDAEGVTEIRFDVRPDGLVVENDGVFRDCGDMEPLECSWRASHGHTCDFHRFRHVAGGDKRNEVGTTGAFGIGFTAVYQITDRPELLSNGRHWILDELAEVDKRIGECEGCEACQAEGLPPTRFVLPWVWDDQSPLRTRLRADAVRPTVETELLDEFVGSLPTSMLFLKRIRSAAVLASGQPQRRIERLDEGSDLILSIDGTNHVWHLLKGDFDTEGRRLKGTYSQKIEPSRGTEVTIAVPSAGQSRDGLLCAFLPTQFRTGLPFHLNADFFPSSDRKTILLEKDYQAEWNRAAIIAAARLLVENLSYVRDRLQADEFWALLDAARSAYIRAGKGEVDISLGSFWQTLQPSLKSSRIVYTAQGDWVKPAHAWWLKEKEEDRAAAVLTALGLPTVHPALRAYQNVLTSADVGVPLLTLEAFTAQLAAKGLNQRLERSAWPEFLTEESLKQVLGTATILAERPGARPADHLKAVAIIQCRDGALWPLGESRRAGDEVVALFSALKPKIGFVDPAAPGQEILSRTYCPSFDVAEAVEASNEVEPADLEAAWLEGRLDLKGLFAWLEGRQAEIVGEVKAALVGLPLFPAEGRLHQLAQLALAGDFDDPLGLAMLVDLTAIGGRRDLLRFLGMPELTFQTYATEQLPRALANQDLTYEKRRSVAALLATRLGEIKDNAQARRRLRPSRIVECTDGEFRDAESVYFASTLARECLPPAVHFARLPEEHRTAFGDLYDWLGVANRPRPADLLRQIEEVTARPPDDVSLQRIEAALVHLASTYAGVLPESLASLTRTAWLPARGRFDRWFPPAELHTVFRAYLFESQGVFLNVSRDAQNGAQDLLKAIGVQSEPTTEQVVRHLLTCAAGARAVNREVYRFLDEHSDEKATLPLLGERCLAISEGRYVDAASVFWGHHPFGRYRAQLGADLRAYLRLFERLGVREAPDWRDALAVLKEISGEFSATNITLTTEAASVLATCWDLLDQAAPGNEDLAQAVRQLGQLKCVANARGILSLPSWVFFENRVGIAEKFDGLLQDSLIPRPLAGAAAMQLAGVRPLMSAVEVLITERDNVTPDEELATRLQERRGELARVIEAQARTGAPASDTLGALERLRFERADPLEVQYKLRAFNLVRCSRAEPAAAQLMREESVILLAAPDGLVPWLAVAREMALAAQPDREPGALAAGIKEVLAADTQADARGALDLLGYAALDSRVCAPPEPEVVTGMGEAGVEGGCGSVRADGPAPAHTGPGSGATAGIEGGPGGVEQPSGVGGGGLRPAPGGTVGSGPLSEARGARQRSEGRLRSYVVPRGTSPTPEAEGRAAARSEIDEAGIKAVAEFERAAGRVPEVKPHTFPGYDVESRDASDRLVRLIEVKSVKGDWDGYGVGLSKRQFETARAKEALYWLYVVERAGSPEARVIRINDPASRVDQYLFDDGWESAREEDGAEPTVQAVNGMHLDERGSHG